MYINFLHKHFTPDDYAWYYTDKIDSLEIFSKDSRLVQGLFFTGMHNILGLNVIKYQQFWTVSSIFLLSCSCYVILALVRLSLPEPSHSYETQALAVLSPILIIFTLFSVEFFMFTVATFSYALSTLFVVLAIRVCVSGNSKKHNIGAFVLFLVSLFTYQLAAGLFIPLGLVFAYGKIQHVNKKFFMAVVRLSGIYGLGMLVNYAYAVFIHPLFFSNTALSRIATTDLVSTAIRNIPVVAHALKEIIFHTYDMLPSYLLLLLVITLSGGIAYQCCFIKKRLSVLWLTIIVLFFLAICVMLPQFFAPPGQPTLPHSRTVAPLASILGVMALVYTLYLRNSFQKMDYVVLAVMLFWIFSVTGSVHSLSKDQLLVNKVDHEIAKAVVGEIEAQEKKLGTVVRNIAYTHDLSTPETYENIYTHHSTNKRALRVPWSITQVLRYVSDRNFQLVDMPTTIFKQHFQGKNWDYFASEQIVVIGDTAYLAIY
ncbi:MAG: glucosyltransferase domain-containing protein [Lentisphaerae bacterium]|nr:glucosyltransferase domain-containing protein [Lentisphaerota bacterium]